MPAGLDQDRTRSGALSPLPDASPPCPTHPPSASCPRESLESQSERTLPSNRPNSDLAPSWAHQHPGSEHLHEERTPAKPPGGARHRSPRHLDTPLDPYPEVSGAPTPLEPLVTHRASRVCGRRLRPARFRRSPRTCSARSRRS